MDQEMSLPKTSKKSASKSKSKRKTNRPSEPETTPDINPERKLEIKPEIKPDPSRSKLDDLGFLEISPGIEPVVDIIAIHGLQGHREKTWTTDDGVCWLRGLLPSDLPNVRILSYGYDADTDSHECVSTQTIGRQAEGLANALVRIREGASRRPMIFIAHNIGGIILKRALVISHNQNPGSKGHLRDILVSTHGVLFFGTPHFGAENTTFLEGINLVLSLYMETTDAVLKDLRSHSTELENIQKDWVAASENISSIFFCEDYVMSNQGEVNVPHHSASIAGDRNATMVILHADHRNLVRFPSRENDNYKAVHYHLKEYVNTAPEAILDKWVQEDDLRNVVLGEPTPKRAIQLSELMVHLPSVTFVPSSVHNTCLKGTRKAVLEAIQDWANNGDSSKPIFWLCDIAGSGKSTVAMTAMESWRKQGVLGGQFFFSMASSDASTTDRLCSSIARDLAQFLPKLTPYLSQAVTGNPSIMQSSFDDQFQTLVTGPVELWKGHVVLVIDAVDECKSTSQRKKLLDTLSTAVQKCKNLRVFMTSRPDPVIESVLGSLSVKAKLEDRLHNVNHPNNISDIALYVHQSLNQTLSEEKRQRLVGKANGLFIWASTACRMINDETKMETPEEIYDRLVSLEEPGAIDEVYDLAFERTGKESYAIQCQMLALLLVAFEPLTVGDMEDLVKHVGVRGSVKRLIRNLGSVLSVEPGTNLVQFRHPTLFEYLGRCSIAPVVGDSKKIYLDAVNAHGQVASWCVRCLKSRTDGLKFNICRIESSFRLNRQIPDLEARVSRFITRRLRYASSHWLFHMSGTDGKRRCMLEKEFGAVVQSPRVLHWMEALSLTRGVPRAIAGLRALAGHIELKGETRRRISDIRRCLIAFSVPIQESAPHVYISVLPFTPKESILRIEGVREYGGTLNVIRGLEHAYPGPPMALQGHEESVSGVAFSPDGSRIASCSEDHTIRLWDVDTGEPMGNPFRGHSGSVWAVAFSPDGSRVASGSADKTIRLWDANTGEQLGEPLRGHSDWVKAVAFSPDGVRVVSGSWDRTIRLWDANTGEQVGEPLRDHSSWVNTVAFSPDGSRVVSGSNDKTIRRLGQCRRILTRRLTNSSLASGDKTIRLWGANTGEQVGEPLRGYSDSVNAVAFSSDGSHIASGFANTVQILDNTPGSSSKQLIQRYEHPVLVTSSPDGPRIVSCSTGDINVMLHADSDPDINQEGGESTSSYLAEEPQDVLVIPGFNQCLLTYDGWVQSTGRFLFWVPPNNRYGLQNPRLILTMPTSSSFRATKLDFTNFQCGPSWTNVQASTN
ncbi:hypothetical protein PIIN_05106 [Serendipita indica DSM 11827]|uniref:Nephrocystin 3-like N-terminal domain-containing protein n=1 Tax=Serendipita indica (strain DSM 11827) TaxID=1109443 RepID=G4TIM7_SERID|nr:hypothetical protein PIIN_05106 [Serendipita indica DSM 11827]